jgi:hypothetical protein
VGLTKGVIMKKEEIKDHDFGEELETLINRYNKEVPSNTPDYILAKYIQSCLDAFNKAVVEREIWYGRPIK